MFYLYASGLLTSLGTVLSLQHSLSLLRLLAMAALWGSDLLFTLDTVFVTLAVNRKTYTYNHIEIIIAKYKCFQQPSQGFSTTFRNGAQVL